MPNVPMRTTEAPSVRPPRVHRELQALRNALLLRRTAAQEAVEVTARVLQAHLLRERCGSSRGRLGRAFLPIIRVLRRSTRAGRSCAGAACNP